jgi:hypothetical protein
MVAVQVAQVEKAAMRVRKAVQMLEKSDPVLQMFTREGHCGEYSDGGFSCGAREGAADGVGCGSDRGSDSEGDILGRGERHMSLSSPQSLSRSVSQCLFAAFLARFAGGGKGIGENSCGEYSGNDGSGHDGWGHRCSDSNSLGSEGLGRGGSGTGGVDVTGCGAEFNERELQSGGCGAEV